MKKKEKEITKTQKANNLNKMKTSSDLKELLITSEFTARMLTTLLTLNVFPPLGSTRIRSWPAHFICVSRYTL